VTTINGRRYKEGLCENTKGKFRKVKDLGELRASKVLGPKGGGCWSGKTWERTKPTLFS